MTLDLESVPVVFNMTLANGDTSARFCEMAAAVLEIELDDIDRAYLDRRMGAYDGGNVSEIVQKWTDRLDDAGYSVHWTCGDVVVYDLRGLSDEEAEEFWEIVAW